METLEMTSCMEPDNGNSNPKEVEVEVREIEANDQHLIVWDNNISLGSHGS